MQFILSLRGKITYYSVHLYLKMSLASQIHKNVTQITKFVCFICEYY